MVVGCRTGAGADVGATTLTMMVGSDILDAAGVSREISAPAMATCKATVSTQLSKCDGVRA